MSDQELFRTILKRSWDLIIKRPSMWLLAFFASSVAGTVVIDSAFNTWTTLRNVAAPKVRFSSIYANDLVGMLAPPYENILVPLVAILLISIGVGFFVVSVISLGGLIRAAVDKKEHSIKTAWHQGVKHMYEIGGIVIARKVIAGVLMILGVLLIQWLLQNFSNLGSVLSGIIIFAYIVLFALISMLSVYAQTAIIVDQLSFSKSIIKAWDVFKKHVLLSIEMAMSLFIVEMLVIGAFGILILLLGAPVLLMMAAANAVGSVLAITAIATFGVMLFVASAFLVTAWYTQFTISAWAFLYVKIRKDTIKSRILHILGH